MGWPQDRIGGGQDAADEDGMEDGTTMEEQELAETGIRIGRRGGEEMARWAEEHIEATLRRGAPARWIWDWAMWGWLMERARHTGVAKARTGTLQAIDGGSGGAG